MLETSESHPQELNSERERRSWSCVCNLRLGNRLFARPLYTISKKSNFRISKSWKNPKSKRALGKYGKSRVCLKHNCSTQVDTQPERRSQDGTYHRNGQTRCRAGYLTGRELRLQAPEEIKTGRAAEGGWTGWTAGSARWRQGSLGIGQANQRSSLGVDIGHSRLAIGRLGRHTPYSMKLARIGGVGGARAQSAPTQAQKGPMCLFQQHGKVDPSKLKSCRVSS